MTDDLPSAALQAFSAIVGVEHLLTDTATRSLYSRDVAGWDDGPMAGAVARPASAEEIAALLQAAGRHQVAVAIRGGGVSYTQGYVPLSANSLMLDLSRLNAIHELNTTDLYATVGAACTFEQLDAAVRPHGLRPLMRGPISGGVATVGGIAAQNSGSAPMAGVIAVEVVLPDGRIVRTGSSARAGDSSPFYRNYGPDLTGLFLGDTGAFGVKTRITLALEAIPAGVACASIAFTTMHNIAQVMLQIGRTGITCRQLGMDALKNRTATKVGIGEGLGTLAKVVGNAGSLGAGLKQAAGIALAGRKLLDKVEWSLHLTVEGPDQAAADRALAALRPLWASTGHEVAPSVPIAMLARPYSIRGILGINGERWLPVHGVFPPSQVASVVQATEAFFARHAERLARHQIDHSFIMVGARAHWVLEPMFYWRDEIGALQRHVLGSKAGKFSGLQADPEARAVVRELRSELSALFSTLGAVHSQLGKFYEFDHSLRPDTRALLTAIKDTIDPTHQLNPGNLGWK